MEFFIPAISAISGLFGKRGKKIVMQPDPRQQEQINQLQKQLVGSNMQNESIKKQIVDLQNQYKAQAEAYEKKIEEYKEKTKEIEERLINITKELEKSQIKSLSDLKLKIKKDTKLF